MSTLRGSIDRASFSALRRLLADLKKTGWLYVRAGAWTSCMYLDNGEVLAGTLNDANQTLLGSDRGESQQLQFEFVDSEATDGLLPIESTIDANAQLRTISDDAAKLNLLSRTLVTLPLLRTVPHHADMDSCGADPIQVTRSTLGVLGAIDGRQTIAELADTLGMSRTLRELARLLELGLIRVETPVEHQLDALHLAASRACEPELASPTLSAFASPTRSSRQELTHADDSAIESGPRCPELGYVDDRSRCSSQATMFHRCFASGQAETVSTRQQQEFCLGTAYSQCPRLNG